jgi:rod shape-determining protein MreC
LEEAHQRAGLPIARLAGEKTVIRLAALRRSSAQRIVVPILVLISAIMIILAKIDQVMFESLRISATDDAAPILDMLSRPPAAIEYIFDRGQGMIHIYQDNLRLVEENKRLLRWQQTALALASENAQLRDLLKLTPEAAVSYVTARVIASSGGAFLRSLTVDAGAKVGVVRRQAAVTGEGLVGRVYEVGDRTARILLITDLNSRVPVIVERSRQRAILAGDNSRLPSLSYFDPATAVRSGDRIVTSGEGGVFPPGLPVGIVDTVDHGPPRVEPYAELSQVEYVRIVDYGLTDALPTPVATASPFSRDAGSGTADTANRR